MTNANWGLLGGNNALAMFQQGAAMGADLRARQKESATENALAAYATNPNDPAALQGVIKADARIGLQLQGQQAQRQALEKQADLRRRAASGDQQAMSELFAVDLDAWGKLDTTRKESVKQAASIMGNAVQSVASLPEEQRAAAWAAHVRQAEASGLDIPTEMETYSPQALQSAAVRFEVVDKFLKLAEPDWRVVPQGGYLENVNPRSRSTPIQSGPQSAPPPPPGFQIDGQGGPASAPASFQP